MPTLLGTRIKEARKAAGLTQRQLAEIINVSNTSISNWEKNLSEPSLEIIRLLAQFFDVSIDYLLGHVNDPLFYLDNERIVKSINSYDGDTADFEDIKGTEKLIEYIKFYYFSLLSESQKQCFFSILSCLRGAPDEVWNKVLEYAELLAEKHKKETKDQQ